MQNAWFKCGKIQQNAEGLAGMHNVTPPEGYQK